ncbi:MAG: NADH:flavin oxidoreductase [bacterium]|nr:NADH:flavin oxidoreductase [bacterium]
MAGGAVVKFTSPGQHKSVEAFRAHLQSIDPKLDCASELSGAEGPLGAPCTIGDKTIGNRFAIHPMEGWDGTARGLPSDHTLRRWRRFGSSGAKLIWGGEAFAVQEDGRANAGQLYLNPRADVKGALDRLLGEIFEGHAEIGEKPDDLLVGLQLTHSGRFSRPGHLFKPRIAGHNPALDKKFGIPADFPILTDGELEAIGENYVAAAKLAWQVGFEFVDVKACHGYLMHELLGAKSRPGPYGGRFENRTKLFRRVVDDIRATCPGLSIGVRVSIADVIPFTANPRTGVGEPIEWKGEPFDHGFGIDADDPTTFDLEEPLTFLGFLRDLGIELVNLSIGSPYYCPHLQRPAAYPPSDGYLPPHDPLADVAEHLLVTRACKAAFPELLLVGSGYTYLQDWLAHVAEYEVGAKHVDFVGLGRMTLSYPSFPHDVLSGKPLQRKGVCRTFSDCTTAPRNGMISGCYPLDVYYRALPEYVQLQDIKKARRRQ